MPVQRLYVSVDKKASEVFKIINLETATPVDTDALSELESLFANGVTEHVVTEMPEGDFHEVIYQNGVIDPQQDIIQKLCVDRGINVLAAKVSHRYYGKSFNGVYVNKLVHTVYTTEPELVTLRPRGVRQPMQYYDLTVLSDTELKQLSRDRQMNLSLTQMYALVRFQKQLGLSAVTDVFLETFAARWSDHCEHTLWKSLGLLDKLKSSTEESNNPNVISAFVDNAGVWDFYDGLCLLFKLETHNSPTQSEPYGGQLTKLGGVLRDIFENGLGAKPIGNIELTVVGEFDRKRYPELTGQTIDAATMARETILAIAGYGNPMGVPMVSAAMMSHPDFSGKPFALGGSIGITTHEAGQKGRPRPGDLAVLVGGRTGNDGLHGATVSSSGITEATDQGDSTHVQIGLPYTEQLMMRAGLELRDSDCLSARNDFGAAGIVSCFGEMGETTEGSGGISINLALVPLKSDGMANWQIALSESQERFGHAVKPEKWDTAKAIYDKYGLEATIIGEFTETGRFQMNYEAEACLDVPYEFFDQCPLPQTEVFKPRRQSTEIQYPEITLDILANFCQRVVSHFEVCDQSFVTSQYDHTVQGITLQGPLYGINQNVASSLGVLQPVFGKPYGATLSLSFSPWQFEIDPVSAAVNAMMDALVTQAVAGVAIDDIALADNFYTDGADPESLWHLSEQVQAISELARVTKTPFIVGKDSSSGRGTYGGVTVKVPPSVCITALGKICDINTLIPHKWQRPGNKLIALGPKTTRLDGSLLASSLGITGNQLDRFPVEGAREYLELLNVLAKSSMLFSAVPINRGGIFLRLFEGIEATGFGFEADILEALFPESMGCVLVEVSPDDADTVHRHFSDINPLTVGTILPRQGFAVQGHILDFGQLRTAWQTTFEERIHG